MTGAAANSVGSTGLTLIPIYLSSLLRPALVLARIRWPQLGYATASYYCKRVSSTPGFTVV